MFSSVYELLKEGKFDSAEGMLGKLHIFDNPLLKIEKLVLQSRIYENQSKIAIGEVEKLTIEATNLAKEISSDFLQLKILISRAYVFFKKGDYNYGIQDIDEAEKILKIVEAENSKTAVSFLSFWKAEMLVLKGILHGWSRSLSIQEFETSKEYLSEAFEICESIDYYFQLTNCLNWIALFQLYNHNLGDAKNEIERSLAISQPRNILHSVGSSQLLFGSYYWLQGEYDKANEWYRKGRDLARSINNRWLEASANSFAGSVAILQGDLTIAYETLEEASNIYEEMGDMHYLAFNNLELGEVLLQRGDIEEALISFNEALETFIKIGDKVCRNRTYVKLGKAFQSQGLKSLALKNYENAILTSNRNVVVPVTIYAWFYCDAFYNAILIELERENLPKAEEYLTLLESIDTSSPNKRINYTTKLSHALVLYSKGNLLAARTIFEELLKDEVQDNEMHEQAIVKYIDILLLDFAQVPNDSVEDNINLTLRYLEGLATSQDNTPLQIEVYILKANLQKVFGNFIEASEILDIALNQAINHNLIELERKVEHEVTSLKLLTYTSKAHEAMTSAIDTHVEREVLNYLQTLSTVIQSNLLNLDRSKETEADLKKEKGEKH